MRRNQVAKLSQNSELGGGWFGLFFFNHLCRVTELKSHSNHFFSWFNQASYGMAVIVLSAIPALAAEPKVKIGIALAMFDDVFITNVRDAMTKWAQAHPEA